MPANTAREAMLGRVRHGLGRTEGQPPPPVPPSARIARRTAGRREDEISLLLAKISALGGTTRRVTGAGELKEALAELVQAAGIRRAALWDTPDLAEWGLAAALAGCGVEIVPGTAGKHALANCDLGVTGADAALPETGTLCLRSSPERPRLVSLLPRVHLALVRPAALVADWPDVFADYRHDHYGICITGPSRTSDIELTVTIGVHGPKELYVWMVA